jgi:hypothetical protein
MYRKIHTHLCIRHGFKLVFFKLLHPSLTQVPIGFSLELSYLPGPAVRVSRLIFDYYRPSSETSTALL